MRKRLFFLAFLLGLSAPAPAAADDAFIEDVTFVGLTPGVAAFIRIDDDGGVAYAPAGEASLAEVDRDVLQQMAVLYDDPEQMAQSSGPNAKGFNASGSTPRPVAPGVVRISLLAVKGRSGNPETLLVLENGYGQAMRYRATMSRGERSAVTDVCSVLPGLRGYEHWPYPIDRIDLSSIRLEPYRAGTPPVCE
jgi:hypothetical protein